MGSEMCIRDRRGNILLDSKANTAAALTHWELRPRFWENYLEFVWFIVGTAVVVVLSSTG